MNRNQRAVLILACLLSLLIGSAIGAGAPRALLPVIANGAQPPTVVTLVGSDTTFVSAARDSSTGRIYVAYIDRAHGNKAHFTELVDDKLIDVLPPQPGSAAPAFSPDSPKDADSSIVAFDGWVYWFVSSREVDIAGAKFVLQLWRWQP